MEGELFDIGNIPLPIVQKGILFPLRVEEGSEEDLRRKNLRLDMEILLAMDNPKACGQEETEQ